MACNHHTNESCIHSVPIFKHLTTNEVEMLDAVIQSKQYKKGEFIFREGEKSETLYILHEGTVKISKLSDTGKEQVIRFLFPGDYFGHFAFLQEKKHYANAEVLDSASICCIQKRDFQQILEHNPKMTYQFLLAISERLAQADEWMGTISLMETEQRLAKLLLLFYEKNNAQSEIRLPVKKKEMAALLGTTPETLSRKLAHFEELGIIFQAQHSIIIRQPKLLKDFAG